MAERKNNKKKGLLWFSEGWIPFETFEYTFDVLNKIIDFPIIQINY